MQDLGKEVFEGGILLEMSQALLMIYKQTYHAAQLVGWCLMQPIICARDMGQGCGKIDFLVVLKLSPYLCQVQIKLWKTPTDQADEGNMGFDPAPPAYQI